MNFYDGDHDDAALEDENDDENGGLLDLVNDVLQLILNGRLSWREGVPQTPDTPSPVEARHLEIKIIINVLLKQLFNISFVT